RVVGFNSDENVNVIWFVFDRDKFVLLVLDDSRDVHLQFGLVVAGNEARATFDRENKMDVELCVGIRHPIFRSYGASKILDFVNPRLKPGATNISLLRSGVIAICSQGLRFRNDRKSYFIPSNFEKSIDFATSTR